jgi:hypothetical protein
MLLLKIPNPHSRQPEVLMHLPEQLPAFTEEGGRAKSKARMKIGTALRIFLIS